MIRLSTNLNLSDEEFVQQWGNEKLFFRDEKKFVKVFHVGFNLWWKHDAASIEPERILHSWEKSSPHFIISTKHRNQGFISLFDEVQVILDKSYILPYMCKKSTKCMYTTRDKYNMSRHEETCRDTTRIKYKQMWFGNHSTIRKALINEGIIDENDDSCKRFVAYDIEAVNCADNLREFGKSIITGCQKVISIGYTANFGGYKDVFVRNDMSKQSGIDLVKIFLQKMEQLQLRHFERIPEKIKDAMAQYKEQLKIKSLSVSVKSNLQRRLWYLRSICNLKVIAFNSQKYDLLVLITLILEVANLTEIRVIKKGNAIFDLKIGLLCFRDAINYCGPMSLAKFAKIFKLPEVKGLFPYEKFSSIDEIYKQISWPNYKDFLSSLPSKQVDYSNDLRQILSDKETWGFQTLRDMFIFFDFKSSSFTDIDLSVEYLPTITTTQQEEMNVYFTISPMSYLTEKLDYETAVACGKFRSYVDYLCHYNQLDCDLLSDAMTKFITIFDECFNVTLLDRLSLPGISEDIMWSSYDVQSPKMFSFDARYGFLNKQIREKLMGGPTLLFHRHVEIKNEGLFDDSVYTTENGDKYKRVVSYDFNALYGFAMKNDLPTGIPFYYKKQFNGSFSFIIAANKSGWSYEALSWLNYMSYDKRFMKKDGSFYNMKSVVTGEVEICCNGHNYKIDGVVECDTATYYLEFMGCRIQLSKNKSYIFKSKVI